MYFEVFQLTPLGALSVQITSLVSRLSSIHSRSKTFFITRFELAFEFVRLPSTSQTTFYPLEENNLSCEPLEICLPGNEVSVAQMVEYLTAISGRAV